MSRFFRTTRTLIVLAGLGGLIQVHAAVARSTLSNEQAFDHYLEALAHPDSPKAAWLIQEGDHTAAWPRPDLREVLDTESTANTPAAEHPEANGIDVWERIRRGFAMPDLETHAASRSTRWYAAQPEYIDRMANRAIPYLFHIVEEVERRGMPTELALLPFVESAMQPQAKSHAKAVGLWQFIPSTGRLYSLEQNHWHDQRQGVIESTRAALDYLQKLYNEFGDWHLALAAYNCGEGCVSRALRRSQARKQSTRYEHLRLPRETRGYVPKLQAMKNIVRDPQRHNLALPTIENKPYFVAITKERDIDVATAAKLAEISVEEFRALNPAFKRPVIVGATQPSILLPAERKETFLSNLAAWEASDQPLSSWTTYTLASNETISEIAQRIGVPETTLREANRIPPRHKVRPHSTILVPRSESVGGDIDLKYVHAAFSHEPLIQRVIYRVRRGDTLSRIARRWRVDVRDIMHWNNLRSHRLIAGQRLQIHVSGRSSGAQHVGHASQKNQPTTTVTYQVRRGDTLSQIARRWRVGVRDIMRWNGLRSHRLVAGQHLKLIRTKGASGTY